MTARSVELCLLIINNIIKIINDIIRHDSVIICVAVWKQNISGNLQEPHHEDTVTCFYFVDLSWCFYFADINSTSLCALCLHLLVQSMCAA